MKQKINRKNSFAFVFLLLISCIFILGLGLLSLFTLIGMTDIMAGLFAAQLSILIFALALFKFNSKELLETANFKIKFKDVMIVLGSVFLILIVNSIIGFIANFLGLDQGAMSDYTENTTEAMALSNNILTMLVFPIIIAPIFEELAFRAGFKKALMDNSSFSAFQYVVISSVVFGFLHYQPGINAITPVLVTGSIGAINAILYLKTKNILIPIAVHVLYNSLVMYLVFSGL